MPIYQGTTQKVARQGAEAFEVYRGTTKITTRPGRATLRLTVVRYQAERGGSIVVDVTSVTANGLPIQGYRYRLRYVGGAWSTPRTHSGTRYGWEADTLLPGEQLEAQALAYNLIGDGEWSNIVLARIPD